MRAESMPSSQMTSATARRDRDHPSRRGPRSPTARRWKSTRRVAISGVRVASGDRAGERDGVRVVGVEQDRAAGPDLAQDGRQDTRVEPDGPRRLADPDAVRAETEAELGGRAGHDHLVREAGALQLAGEQPHLALPAAPLAAGRDVDDGLGHVSGMASIGRLPRPR